MSEHAAGAGSEAPPPSNTEKRDTAARRGQRPARLWGLARIFLLLAVLTVLTYAAWRDPRLLNPAFSVLIFAAQVGLLLLGLVSAYVGLFWFLSRSRVEIILPEDPKAITLEDYWGQPRLVRLAKQWITLFAGRAQFAKMGGRPINGILIYGPPGSGKTMLAKAMAGEARLPFISAPGSGFQTPYPGIDALKMMWFLRKAKQLARDAERGACIVHIDDVEALGAARHRGPNNSGLLGSLFGSGGAGALARLLYEMDSADEQRRGRQARDWHLIYMASTSRPDLLDPTLLRRGRFDQKIRVGIPNRTGRREIVAGYLSKVQHDDTVSVEAIVEDMPGATPAEIAAALTKDAVRIALFNGRDRISQRDIDQALEEQVVGLEQPIEEWDPEQRRQVAYHEAGHTVAQHYLMPDQRIVRVTIVRRGSALGYMRPVDRVEVYTEPLRRIAAGIMVSMAGHVATRIFMGELWTGASADFSKIRNEIWDLYSLGYFGVHDIDNKVRGAPTNADPLIERFWRTLDEQTERLLREHAGEVEAIAQKLLEKNELTHDEVMELLGDNGWRPDQPQTIRPQRELSRLSPAPLPIPVPATSAPAEGPLAESQQKTLATEAADPHGSGNSPSPRPIRMVPPPRPEDFMHPKSSAPPTRPPPEKEPESKPEKP